MRIYIYRNTYICISDNNCLQPEETTVVRYYCWCLILPRAWASVIPVTSPSSGTQSVLPAWRKGKTLDSINLPLLPSSCYFRPKWPQRPDCECALSSYKSIFIWTTPPVKAQCPPLRVNQVNQTLLLCLRWRTKRWRQREWRKIHGGCLIHA